MGNLLPKSLAKAATAIGLSFVVASCANQPEQPDCDTSDPQAQCDKSAFTPPFTPFKSNTCDDDKNNCPSIE